MSRARGDARRKRARDAQAHRRLESWMARAMSAHDPLAVLEQAAADPGLTPELRDALRAADPDGVRLAALLVARLRFERLMRGCPEAEAEFEHAPEAFAATFRRYHAEVAPAAFFPAAEAELFRAWQRRCTGPERPG